MCDCFCDRLSVCLSMCLSLYLCVCTSVSLCLSVCPCVCLSICLLAVCLCDCLCACLSVRLSVCICLSVCLSGCVCDSLYVCLYVCLWLFAFECLFVCDCDCWFLTVCDCLRVCTFVFLWLFVASIKNSDSVQTSNVEVQTRHCECKPHLTACQKNTHFIRFQSQTDRSHTHCTLCTLRVSTEISDVVWDEVHLTCRSKSRLYAAGVWAPYINYSPNMKSHKLSLPVSSHPDFTIFDQTNSRRTCYTGQCLQSTWWQPSIFQNVFFTFACPPLSSQWVGSWTWSRYFLHTEPWWKQLSKDVWSKVIDHSVNTLSVNVHSSSSRTDINVACAEKTLNV